MPVAGELTVVPSALSVAPRLSAYQQPYRRARSARTAPVSTQPVRRAAVRTTANVQTAPPDTASPASVPAARPVRAPRRRPGSRLYRHQPQPIGDARAHAAVRWRAAWRSESAVAAGSPCSGADSAPSRRLWRRPTKKGPDIASVPSPPALSQAGGSERRYDPRVGLYFFLILS